jgi:hypothetical protein
MMRAWLEVSRQPVIQSVISASRAPHGQDRGRTKRVTVPSSRAEITFVSQLTEHKGDFVWLGVRDGIRNWLVTARLKATIRNPLISH